MRQTLRDGVAMDNAGDLSLEGSLSADDNDVVRRMTGNPYADRSANRKGQ